MNDQETRRENEGPIFSAQDARQGEIILRTRTRRIIFIAGLVGIVVLAIVLRFAIG
ncbi:MULTISPECIES: peptide ABC transporter permease [unclassified Mesorhizobium]|uniref:peptide ABC transporter permease n=1 Tax=unclassified Mesorhizobium TaxID=325217 RepID=UPI00112B16B7|nr:MULTISPECIES: peptide ABC transporter permease [unclassified Mesorhizobium]TPK92521.1 peptide ABC transporter permease [Mesorhizobium sp. B2-4-17]TPL07145.1 peptide ABC transporter permease [Mesorhizobium sp. B2-4-14]